MKRVNDMDRDWWPHVNEISAVTHAAVMLIDRGIPVTLSVRGNWHKLAGILLNDTRRTLYRQLIEVRGIFKTASS